MQSNQNELQTKIDIRLRTVRILWFALFLSIAIYYAMTFLIPRNEHTDQNKTLSLVLVGIGLLLSIVAVPIKQKYLTQSAAQHRVDVLQTGYIITWAVTEAAALFGLLDYFTTTDRYYYVLFIIAGCGMLLHSPRRRHVEDASFKTPGF
jgi:F0F1-type ATP synthase membrane subunit c/vacuolar-type H+-ATPase subunit K